MPSHGWDWKYLHFSNHFIYYFYYYETTGCENFIFQKSKIQNCVIKKMRGTYYYLLQRKNANIRGTVADHQVVTPDPICNLTMFYRLKQFWAVLCTRSMYYPGLGNRIYCVDQYIAYCNILLPEANIAIIAICLRRILQYCNIAIYCTPRLQYIGNIRFPTSASS